MKSSFLAEGSAIHSGTLSRPQGDALVPYRKIRSFPAFAGVNFSGNSDGFASSASSAALGPRNGGSPRRRHPGAPRGRAEDRVCYGSAATARGENCAGGMIRAEVVRALDGEKVRKPRTRAIDPALDRANRAVANGGGLLVGKARCPDQDQRFPLVRRQLGERRAEFIELHQAVLFGMRFQALSIGAVGIFDLAPSLAFFFSRTGDPRDLHSFLHGARQ